MHTTVSRKPVRRKFALAFTLVDVTIGSSVAPSASIDSSVPREADADQQGFQSRRHAGGAHHSANAGINS